MYIHTHINEEIFKTKVLTNKEDIQLGMMGKNLRHNLTRCFL